MDFRKIKKVLWLILGLNLAVAISKIVLGALTGTISILSDGIHSVFDGATNVVGLIGIKFAEKPADEDHPYGHRKYEAITSQIIFTFLVIAGWKIGENIFEKISNPSIIRPSIHWLTFAVLVSCMIIDGIVAWRESKMGVKLESAILQTDAEHTKSHYITTGAVLLSAIGIKIGLPVLIEPLAACVVLVFIADLARRIFKKTSSVLSDKALTHDKIEKIKKIVDSMHEVVACHQIRSRGDGSHYFLDIHVIFDPQTPLFQAHQVCHLICNKIQKEIPEVKDIVVHPEPK